MVAPSTSPPLPAQWLRRRAARRSQQAVRIFSALPPRRLLPGDHLKSPRRPCQPQAKLRRAACETSSCRGWVPALRRPCPYLAGPASDRGIHAAVHHPEIIGYHSPLHSSTHPPPPPAMQLLSRPCGRVSCLLPLVLTSSRLPP